MQVGCICVAKLLKERLKKRILYSILQMEKQKNQEETLVDGKVIVVSFNSYMT
jgi:hypothetical protein